jgi:hypothetical protein
MVLSTPAFSDGAVIPNKHTQVQQAERGISPQLVWTNAPAATQSFVLNMHDPEVSRNKTTDDQVHWLVWNIPGTKRACPKECRKAPSCRTASGKSARAATCIAAPAHRCRSDASLHLRGLRSMPSSTFHRRRRLGDPAQRFKAMDGHVIGKAVMVGMFKRPQ